MRMVVFAVAERVPEFAHPRMGIQELVQAINKGRFASLRVALVLGNVHFACERGEAANIIERFARIDSDADIDFVEVFERIENLFGLMRAVVPQHGGKNHRAIEATQFFVQPASGFSGFDNVFDDDEAIRDFVEVNVFRAIARDINGHHIRNEDALFIECTLNEPRTVSGEDVHHTFLCYVRLQQIPEFATHRRHVDELRRNRERAEDGIAFRRACADVIDDLQASAVVCI